MDESESTSQVGPPIWATTTEIDAFAGAADERRAREDLEAAQARGRGEAYARARCWRLHVQAMRLGHRRWADLLMARVQVAEAHEREAQLAVRLAAEQLARLGVEQKNRAAALAKVALKEANLTRVVETYWEVEKEAAMGLKKKAAIIKERLNLSRTTYLEMVKEAQKRGRLPRPNQ